MVSLPLSASDVDVIATNHHGATPLVEAVFRANVDVAKAVLGANVDATVSYVDHGASYPLLYLARQSLPMTELLVNRGTRVHGGNDLLYGFTAMNWAAASGSVGVLEFLISARKEKRTNELCSCIFHP